MNKIFLIIQREYLSRVKKKSFIVMTILGPVLMAAIIMAPIILAETGTEHKAVDVVDETGLFINKFENSEEMSFNYLPMKIKDAKETLTQRGADALVYIPQPEVSVPTQVIIYSPKHASLTLRSHIRSVMQKEVELLKLKASGLDPDVLQSIKTEINVKTIKVNESGGEEQSMTEIRTAVGFFGAILIYFFVFMFGVQVMRGVIEEKTNRIVEVIISSVKPFQLMMGKIIGVALVGLTQVLLWVVLTFSLISVAKIAMPETFVAQQELTMQQNNVLKPVNGTTETVITANDNTQDKVFNEALEALRSINYGVIIGAFIFFFLGGYLLYSALFAAVGAAVDNETDTQQFMMPITLPLIFAFVAAQIVIKDPESSLSFWLSIIPFTSPIIMMVRIPFGVSYPELALSAGLLIAGFIGTTWLAAKIYRTGILMYGKKISYKELWKWIRYKN